MKDLDYENVIDYFSVICKSFVLCFVVSSNRHRGFVIGSTLFVVVVLRMRRPVETSA